MEQSIYTVNTTDSDVAGAVDRARAIALEGQSEFTLLFHGPNHVGDPLEQALQDFPSPVYGCSTSGEITPEGYHENTLSAIAFGRDFFTCVARRIDQLGAFGFRQAAELVPAMKSELRQRAPGADAASTFALLLIDSNSQREEFVAAALGSELGNIQLVGGSAGDNWQLGPTPVLFDGRFHYNFHNFVATEQRGVITSATASQRLVHEINGAPASTELGRICGLGETEVDREHLALHPAIITVGERAYPRGFTEILENGTLRCACAIDEGVVFRVAAQTDYIDHLETALQLICDDLGDSLLVFGLECAARRQTVQQQDLGARVSELFSRYNVWGFSCMGEQSNGLNMNHSFNCLAFALPR
jgi:hypothetical protein